MLTPGRSRQWFGLLLVLLDGFIFLTQSAEQRNNVQKNTTIKLPARINHANECGTPCTAMKCTFSANNLVGLRFPWNVLKNPCEYFFLKTKQKLQTVTTSNLGTLSIRPRIRPRNGAGASGVFIPDNCATATTTVMTTARMQRWRSKTSKNVA